MIPPNALLRCPVCQGSRLPYAFSVETHRVVRCEGCGLMMSNPQPTDEQLRAIYGKRYFLLDADSEEGHVSRLKQTTADRYLDLLDRYRGAGAGGQLLEIGCGSGDFLLRAAARGYRVAGVEYSPHACEVARRRLESDSGTDARIVCGEINALADDPNEEGRYDVCALSDVIEHVRDPRGFLEKVHRLLRPGGVIFIATPSLDSWSARLMRGRWMELKPEHLFYFNQATLGSLLFHCGFGSMVHRPCVKSLSADYIAEHFARYPVPAVSPAVRLAHALVPKGLRRRPLPVVASGMVMMARTVAQPERRKLSVVVPIYNEAATVETALDRLLAKEIEGLHTEFILVESNSTDGTREIVQRYAGRPGVRVVLEDRPRGKGHAVRAGFQHTTGDFILIQDADLEYDLEDYEQLLEPLRAGWNSFILGARHGGRAWKMRQFNDQPLVAAALNGAHRFFTGLFNAVFRIRLRDPFTMYKVFRRDCLHGLEFECNRFDFDLELLFRLVQAGHRPVEVPVNYRSRSFKEGKKVSVLRDPGTWLRAALRCRLSTPDPLAALERARALAVVNVLPATTATKPATALLSASAR